METLLFAINAVFPILLLILLGYYLKRIKFLTDDFLKIGNKFVFRVGLPFLLFYNIYNIDSLKNINWSVVIYSELIVIFAFLIGIILVKLTIKEEKQKGVILQCVVRSNYAIIGIPLAESLGGAEAIGIASLLSAFLIPTFNILGVLALSMYKTENNGKLDIKKTLLNIAKNPLIIGVLIGVLALVIRLLIPVDSTGQLVFSLKDDIKFLYKAIENIGKIASPLALIVLGGTFNFNAIKGMLKQIIIGTTSRIVFVPLLGIGLAVILSKYTNIISFDKSIYPALIALLGSPVAVSSAIMAREMDNDGELAGQLVVWTSVFSIITIFITIVILKSINLL